MSNHDIPETSKLVQRMMILAELQEHGALTTSDIREYLNAMMPAPRIMELRRQGWKIRTAMGWWPDSEGRLHRQAKYHFEGRVGGAT